MRYLTLELIEVTEKMPLCVEVQMSCAIWEKQETTPASDATIEQTCQNAYKHITTAGGCANVTQSCKQEECWRRLNEEELTLTSELLEKLTQLNLD